MILASGEVRRVYPERHRLTAHAASVWCALVVALVVALTGCSPFSGGNTTVVNVGNMTAQTAVMPQIDPPRDSANVVFDAQLGATVLFGGMRANGGPPLNETWAWGSRGWHKLQTASAPPSQAQSTGGGMVYDSTHGRIVLVEHQYVTAGQTIGHTWTFDGMTWAEQSSAQTPAALGMLMADDPAGKGVVAFGGVIGASGKTPLYGTATWRWTGEQWTRLQTAAAPTQDDAQYGLMAADTAGHVLLVNQRTGAVWTWDGAAWSVSSPAQKPPSRNGGVMAYDGKLHVIVLAGGTATDASGKNLTDTWGWDGSAWRQLATSGLPGYIEPGDIAYDAAQQVVVAYVVDHSVPASQTWLWDGNAWQRAA
jgi:hypothetical protein